MKYESRAVGIHFTKELKAEPDYITTDFYMPQCPEESMNQMYSKTINDICRNVSTNKMIESLANRLEEVGTHRLYAWRTQPVLDIHYGYPVVRTNLTGEYKDKEEYRHQGIFLETMTPVLMFTIYDVYGGLPTVTFPLKVVLDRCLPERHEEYGPAVGLVNLWYDAITEKFGGIKNLARVIQDDDFSMQPTDDLAVYRFGKTWEKNIPAEVLRDKPADMSEDEYVTSKAQVLAEKRCAAIKEINEQWKQARQEAYEEDKRIHEEYQEKVDTNGLFENETGNIVFPKKMSKGR